MKKLLLISLALVLCASTAFGQAGVIGLYVDNPTFVQCTYADVAPALVPVYAVHQLCPGATASQWMVITGGGFNCTYTGEIIHMPTSIGTTQSGLSVAYGACLASPILLVTINYFCMGTNPTCAYIEVVPDPGSPTGMIEIVDCAYVKHIGSGNAIYFNHDASCDCYDPVKSSSWGGVKALYR